MQESILGVFRGSVIIGQMIADINITEKSFGAKQLMSGVAFGVDDGEKIGVIGRNGIGKSTLFDILAGTDTDYTGSVIYHRGVTVVATAQEHHGIGDVTVMEYILAGLPEYSHLHQIITTYPETMADNMRKINEYSQALDRFGQKGYYQIEEMVAEELKNFQLGGFENRSLASLSGGQKRLIEIVKIMHSDADLALIDEPTNHMDYQAKQQFIDWLKRSNQAMLVITHDRDVLGEVDKIIELTDGVTKSYKGNYEAYLKQNAHSTSNSITEFELLKRRKANLQDKVIQFRRLKERARDPDTIKQFKRRENQAADELAELEKIEKPTFWIDQGNVANLNYKVADSYDKYKARNIRLHVKSDSSRSKHILVKAENLALGYDDNILFDGVNIDLREGEAVELRGRNGAGKTTIIKYLLGSTDNIKLFDGSLTLDPNVRIGVYEQEISEKYLNLPLALAIEQMYLERKLAISETRIRQLMSDYLFTDDDRQIKLSLLSGGQKARFQLISMLANEPQLLILDEPTNHLDLPSIEELESALDKFAGAILYVSHDNYFRNKIGGDVVQVGLA